MKLQKHINIKFILLLFVIVFNQPHSCFAQDCIYYSNPNDSLKVKVKHIDTKYVHYQLLKDGLDVWVHKEKKKNISKVQFQDGLTYIVNPVQISYDSIFLFEPRNNLKILTPRWLGGSFALGFERLTSPRISWSLDINLIYYPDNTTFKFEYINAKGLGIGINRKLYFNLSNHSRIGNFEGYYLIQSINLIRQYNEYIGLGPKGYDRKFGNGIFYNGAAITMGFGRQIVIANKFTIDVFAASGFGFRNPTFRYYYRSPDPGGMYIENTGAYGFALLGRQYNKLTMATRMGINFGYQF